MRCEKKIEMKHSKPWLVIDWIVFSVFAVLCFFSFQQGDIMHTGGSAIAYLNGHILDFYDYNIQFVGGNAYMPSSYILFAIWDIPLKLFGILKLPTMTASFGVIMWYKLLPTLFYLASAILIYKIARVIGMEEKKSKLCAYVFLTTPIGFFSQFIFGQYDSFTVFFMLLGVLFFFRKDYLKFTLFFGISLTFKYFSLLIYIPMLLMAEKRIWHIVKHMILVVIPIAIEILLYLPSEGFRSGVFGFGATSYIFQASLDTQFFSISLFLVFWIVVCGVAYFMDPEQQADFVKWTIFLTNVVTFLIFGMSMWHPQWLLFAVPFWVLGSFLNKKFGIFMILDIILMGFFVLFTVNFWINHVDQNLFSLGIFGDLLAGRINQKLTIRQFYHIQNLSGFYSMFSGFLLVSVIFRHPKFCAEKISEPIEKFWGWSRLRFVGGLAIFLVPAFTCFVVALQAPIVPASDVLFESETNIAGDVGVLTADRTVGEVFCATAGSIDGVEIYVNLYDRTNMSQMTCEIIEVGTDEVQATIDIQVSELQNNTYNMVTFDPVTTIYGKLYEIRFTSVNAVEGNGISIYHTATASSDESHYATVDGFRTDYDLLIRIHGQ